MRSLTLILIPTLTHIHAHTPRVVLKSVSKNKSNRLRAEGGPAPWTFAILPLETACPQAVSIVLLDRDCGMSVRSAVMKGTIHFS